MTEVSLNVFHPPTASPNLFSCPPTHQIQSIRKTLCTIVHAVLSNGREQHVWIQAYYYSQGKYTTNSTQTGHSYIFIRGAMEFTRWGGIWPISFGYVTTTDNIDIHRCLFSQPPKGLWRSPKANKWLCAESHFFTPPLTIDLYVRSQKQASLVLATSPERTKQATNYIAVSLFLHPGLTYDHQGEFKSPLDRFSVSQEGQVVET